MRHCKQFYLITCGLCDRKKWQAIKLGKERQGPNYKLSSLEACTKQEVKNYPKAIECCEKILSSKDLNLFTFQEKSFRMNWKMARTFRFDETVAEQVGKGGQFQMKKKKKQN